MSMPPSAARLRVLRADTTSRLDTRATEFINLRQFRICQLHLGGLRYWGRVQQGAKFYFKGLLDAV